MGHWSRFLTCVLIMAVCLKSVAMTGNHNVSLKLKYNNSSYVDNVTESQLSSINLPHLCNVSKNQVIDNKEASTHFNIHCKVSRQGIKLSIPCNLSESSQRCLPGVHLNHRSCPNIPVLFNNATILYLDSKILSFRNCYSWPFEVIIIASCTSVTLIMIIFSCIVIIRKCLRTKPSEIVAEITTLTVCVETLSKPEDVASGEILTNNNILRTPSPKISEKINNMHSTVEGGVKKPERDSSLADSGTKLLSEIQTSKFIDMRQSVSGNSGSSKIDFIDECNVYSFIANEDRDALHANARDPRSQPPTLSTIDSSTTVGTTRDGVNDTRGVYFILGEEIRDFQNPYNETPTVRDRRDRASSTCATNRLDLVQTERTMQLKLCDTGPNDVYSRLGEEIREFENTYNL
ncbi:unnamed protein product [Lymnaea stagnalis]|uniref:Uncharacterized protein n=1 Tax=Lymnaea stagnalis TaxID=6523 RepID=A0AAV2H4P5_LYMST